MGKEALAKIKKDGVKQKLVGVEIGGAPIEFNFTKWAVKKDGQAIGRITSAIHSPRLKKNIGYAMVPAAHAAMGTKLQVEIAGVGAREATVVAKPFVDPKKDIPKS
jgi:aminomethyltransferase